MVLTAFFPALFTGHDSHQQVLKAVHHTQKTSGNEVFRIAMSGSAYNAVDCMETDKQVW